MSRFFSGKVLLGILVATTATGGFTLGYFVGKSLSSPPALSGVKQSLHEGESVSPPPIPGSKQGGEISSGLPVAQGPSAEARQLEIAPPVPQKSPVTVETRDDKTAAEPSGKVVYTVQAGAFRNQKDAQVLKHKLEAKGYRVSIKKETSAKGVAFFKVRTGEFESKQEASLVAVKLKNTDGLSAFATEKN